MYEIEDRYKLSLVYKLLSFKKANDMIMKIFNNKIKHYENTVQLIIVY